MRFCWMHIGNGLPLFCLEHVLKTFWVILMFLIDSSNQVNTFVMINKTVRWITRTKQITQFKNLWWTASENQVSVYNKVILSSANHMDISIWNYDGFWIVR